jgi:hypothetical protein
MAPRRVAGTAPVGDFMPVAGSAECHAATPLLVPPARLVGGGTSLGALAPVGIFAAAHTGGLPFGPRAGEPVELEPPGLASEAIEVLLWPLLASLGHVMRPRAPRRRPRPEVSSLVS